MHNVSVLIRLTEEKRFIAHLIVFDTIAKFIGQQFLVLTKNKLINY